MNLREEIQEIVAMGQQEVNEVNTSSYITHLIISKIEKRIDSRIKYAQHELIKGQHDFEGKQNIRYEIERLQDLKEEMLK